jgi:hypothetical protein
MQDINIFDMVPEETRNFFQFKEIGDEVQGTYIARNDNAINGFGHPQTIITLKKKDGELIAVGIRHTKTGLIKIMDEIQFGQIIGFKFFDTKPSAISGRNPSKLIRIAHDKNIVDEEWLKEYQEKRRGVSHSVQDENVTKAETSVPENSDAAKVREIIMIAKQKFGVSDEAEIKAKVSEATGLAFISINLDLIIERLSKA